MAEIQDRNITTKESYRREEGDPAQDEELMELIEKRREDLVAFLPLVENKEQLLAIINRAATVLYGGGDVARINLSQLCRYAFSSAGGRRYVQFRVPKKKRGAFRTIDAPVPTLKHIQRCLNVIFQAAYTPHAAAHGFAQGRSVASNARRHVGQNFVYNIDLKDFFPSITSGRVYKRLQAKPFCMQPEAASMVANLCCYTDGEGRQVLPQGAPTSPTITNFICERLDRKLTALAASYGLRYSRYADDITFSGMNNVFRAEGKFCRQLRNIVEEEEHFAINEEKTRLCHRGMRQEVTGLTVNSRINVERGYVKQLRAMLHSWETQGYEEAQRVFAERYTPTKTRRHDQKGETRIENVIAGKLLYMKMIKGGDDSTYRQLLDRYQQLLREQFSIGTGGDDAREAVSDEELLRSLADLDALLGGTD